MNRVDSCCADPYLEEPFRVEPFAVEPFAVEPFAVEPPTTLPAHNWLFSGDLDRNHRRPSEFGYRPKRSGNALGVPDRRLILG